MSDDVQPTAAEVRAAVEGLKAALDRHLDAIENRTGEDDPDVYTAFEALASAAESYDELLYDRYDEVTPFEVPAGEGVPEYAGPESPEAISVLIRRDYAIVEPERLFAQARRTSEGGGEDETVPAALGAVFGEYEPDEIAQRYKEFGLEEGDSTLWVTAAVEPAEPGEWLEAPFDQVDAQLAVCRFDTSAVFEDDLSMLDPD